MTDTSGTEAARAEKVGLPPRPFLYTLDQIAGLLNVSQNALESTYVYFEGRTLGAKNPKTLIARDISPDPNKLDWRISERELTRWMKSCGFRVYERAYYR